MDDQEKSIYIFHVDGTEEELHGIMKEWLVENQFERMEDGDGVYYQNRRRCISYEIGKMQITLYVYLKYRNRTVPLESGRVGMIDAMSYLNILTPLFTELNARSIEG